MVVAALAMALMGVACDDKPQVEPEIEKFLETSVATLAASDTGGEYTFKINASHPWTASTEYEWAKVKPIWGKAGEHTITVTVESSELSYARTATVVIDSDQAELTKEVKLTQAAVSAERLENRKIYYTSTDSKTIKPLNSYNVFGGPTIASNKYSNGKGVLTLSAELKQIGSFAYRDKTTLATMTLPKSLREIGYNTFYGCTSLTDIDLNEGLTTIGYMSFVHCNSLVSVTIPQSVTKIGTAAFAMCPALERFEGKFAEGDGRYLVVNKELVSFAPAGLTETALPDGVTTIQQEVFKECDELAAIALPESLTTIGVSSFRDCKALLAIELPASVKTIGVGAFYGCVSLTEVELPAALTALDINVFGYCSSLKSVTFGEKITKIGERAFEYCALESVVCKATTPPALGADCFDGASAELVIKVPAASVEAYKEADGWKNFTIEPIE